MNTNNLKKFAQAARRKLLDQVAAKLEYVLTSDSAELRERSSQIAALKEELDHIGKEQLIEKVAYTWFNRFMALRFMDANDYQPSGVRIVSPADGHSLPQIFAEVKQNSFPEDILVDRKRVLDLLDGKIPSNHPQNEAYRLLVVGACNALNRQFPFLFERINDFTELLLPDDLTSEFSIVQDIKEGMSIEDCHAVEIIGWLYQFYISEKKDQLINAKKRYKRYEIAPVTQLFTPRWIVEYMVDNTLGQLWKECRPITQLTDALNFYIQPHNTALIPHRNIASPEEVKFFDPCVGSGHILCYAFDLFYKMYEEEGYNPSEIPELILTKNLFGIDIDERASQLAGFALMMKARERYRRFLQRDIELNILAFEESESHPKFQNAKTLGSLIKVSEKDVAAIKIDPTSIFAERDKKVRGQAKMLSTQYDIVVTNPPYLNSAYMEGTLKLHVEREYNETKSDLFACFLIRVRDFTKSNGLVGYICPYVWMFIKSYEWLREDVIRNSTITSLIQLEYNAFGPAVVPICAFTLRNEFVEGYRGSYIKLSQFKGVDNQAPKTLEAIKNPKCGWFYTANQKDFEKIPGMKIGYWTTHKVIEIFESQPLLKQLFIPRKGMDTGRNDRFLRLWFEVNKGSLMLSALPSKWIPYNKGGDFRRWYGNQEYVINWFNEGEEVKGFNGSYIRAEDYFLKESLTWTRISSSFFAVRYSPPGFIFDAAGSSLFRKSNQGSLESILGFLNSKVATEIILIFNPTLTFQIADIANLPVITYAKYDSEVKQLVEISKEEWDSKETSWHFVQNEIIKIKDQHLEKSYELFMQFWDNKFHQLHRYEEELNRQFIEVYGLQDEVTPDVPLEDITMLKGETNIENGKIVFNAYEIFSQFISYAVGCMFGRYSLDKEGLILANQGETVTDYLALIGKSKVECSFIPDYDAIIPVLDDEWFEDDIVGKFHKFLRVTFGEKDFQKNLEFVEEQLVKDIRKYFVKDFYNDHIKRYKKRPIYWMLSSPKGTFNALIYLHRYTPDTLNNVLNSYLREFIQKLKGQKAHLDQVKISGSPVEQNRAIKRIDKLDKMILDCEEYEREILYPLAAERIAIDLDDGVLVNYNKFGMAVKEVKDLNDKKTKKKVREFDWIDVSQIRD